MEQSPYWWTISWSRNSLSAFYGIWGSNTIFRRACYRLLSWASWIQSTASYSISLRSILILSFHLQLSQVVSCLQISWLNCSCIFITHACYISCPSHPFHVITLIYLVKSICAEVWKPV